jgi:hypothetical protein
MPTPAEIAVQTYVAAWQEPDRAVRATMMEACFAEHGRFVTGGREVRGRAALIALMDSILGDPRGLTIQLLSAIDVRGSIFRFRALAIPGGDSAVPETFDAGLVGADGKIELLLTFNGPLPDPQLE